MIGVFRNFEIPMLPGYYASTRRSPVAAPPDSYVSSPTDSSRNSISTPTSLGVGTSLRVSSANGMHSSVAFSPAGNSTVSHPFSNLITPSLGRTSDNGSLLPPVPVQRPRPFRLTPSDTGFSPGLLSSNQVSNPQVSNVPQGFHNIPVNITDNSGVVHQVSPGGSPSFYPMSSVHSSEHTLNMHPQFFFPGQRQGFSNTPLPFTTNTGYVHPFENELHDNISLSESTIHTTQSFIPSATASQVFAAQAAHVPQVPPESMAGCHHSIPFDIPVVNSDAGNSHPSHLPSYPAANFHVPNEHSHTGQSHRSIPSVHHTTTG